MPARLTKERPTPDLGDILGDVVDDVGNFLSGSSARNAWRSISLGDHKSSVQGKLGVPKRIVHDGLREIWEYRFRLRKGFCAFIDGKLVQWQEPF